MICSVRRFASRKFFIFLTRSRVERSAVVLLDSLILPDDVIHSRNTANIRSGCCCAKIFTRKQKIEKSLNCEKEISIVDLERTSVKKERKENYFGYQMLEAQKYKKKRMSKHLTT